MRFHANWFRLLLAGCTGWITCLLTSLSAAAQAATPALAETTSSKWGTVILCVVLFTAAMAGSSIWIIRSRWKKVKQQMQQQQAKSQMDTQTNSDSSTNK